MKIISFTELTTFSLNKIIENMKIKNHTLLKVNNSLAGETIEVKVERFSVTKEPITDTADQPIYTDRKLGVLPDYDIRADRMEYAIEAMDKVTKTKLAKREEYLRPKMEVIKPDDKSTA